MNTQRQAQAALKRRNQKLQKENAELRKEIERFSMDKKEVVELAQLIFAMNYPDCGHFHHVLKAAENAIEMSNDYLEDADKPEKNNGQMKLEV